MEVLYGFGILCIKALQDSNADMEWISNFVNYIFNPHYLMEYAFPVIAAFDSVFGAQLLLSIAFGGWCNTMLKWILVEDRPYWWVRETSYYTHADRPTIRQNIHTCETGPGSPSGHCAAAATVFMLAEMWFSHVARDQKSTKLVALHDKVPVKVLYFLTMTEVAVARVYVGAHFPHQCLLGALIGSLVSPSVCLFITDPYLLRNSSNQQGTRSTRPWHIAMACGTIALSVLLGLVYMLLGVDLHWSIRLAFRWCQQADYITVKSSPVFAIVQSTASLLGWAIAVIPEIAKYRHNTRPRNSVIAILVTALAMYCFKRVQDYVPNRRIPFYVVHFVINLARPYVFLRLIPRLIMAASAIGCDKEQMRVEKQQVRLAKQSKQPKPAVQAVPAVEPGKEQ